MAVERRTIWLTDAEWELLTSQAKAKGITPSALIRDRAIDQAAAGAINDPSFAVFRPVPKPSQKR